MEHRKRDCNRISRLSSFGKTPGHSDVQRGSLLGLEPVGTVRYRADKKLQRKSSVRDFLVVRSIGLSYFIKML